MATGRFSPRFSKFQIGDTAGTLRDIPIHSWGTVGLTYSELNVSAFQEAIESFLSGMATFSLTIGGPFDNSAAASASGSGAVATLSGSHTVLQPLNGALTPRSFGCYFGVLTYWTTGDPVFGATNSIIVTDYKVDPGAGTYTAKIAHVSGASNNPAWGTAAIS